LSSKLLPEHEEVYKVREAVAKAIEKLR